MIAETPHSAWCDFYKRSSGLTQACDELWDLLNALYHVPNRVYHTLEHAFECVNTLYSISETEPPVACELALWFHEAVYIAGDTENESRSAILADTAGQIMGLDSQTREYAVAAVLATRHHETPDQHIAQLVVDADMSILGSDNDRYNKYSSAIRQEWAHVDDETYKQGRHSFLSGLLKRELFITPIAKQKFNAFAQKNILRELKELES